MVTNGQKYVNMPVHVVYAVSLFFLLATRYYLYFGPGKEALQLNFGQALGANTGYFLTWGIGYYLCLTAPSKMLISALGFLSVTAGPLLAPIAGYVLLGGMYFMRKTQLRSHKPANLKPPPQASHVKKTSGFKWRILDPRTTTGFLSILFWVMFSIYVATRQPFIVYILGILIVANLLARIFPIHAHIYYSRFLALVTWGKTRDVNVLFSTLPRLAKMTPAQLNELVQKPNPLVQEAVLDELKTRGDADTTKILLQMAENNTDNILTRIIETVGAIAGSEHAPAISGFLKNEKHIVRRAAAMALSRMNATGEMGKIAAALTNENEVATIRKLFGALWQLGGADQVLSQWKQLPSKTKICCIAHIRKKMDHTHSKGRSFLSAIINEEDPQVLEAISSLQLLWLCQKTRDAYPVLFDVSPERRGINDRQIVLKNVAPSKFTGSEDIHSGASGVAGPVSDLKLTYRFNYFAQSTDNSDILSFILQPKADSAIGWRSESIVNADDFLEFFARAGEPLPATFFLECPENYRAMFMDAHIVSNIQSADDGRDVYDFKVSQLPLSVITKYALYYMDIAIFPANGSDECCMHVCFKQLFDHTREEEIPPFVVKFDLVEFLSAKRETYMYSIEEDDMVEMSSPIISRPVT